jgi:crotonobetainyl-CoA:carnitine CoA-transferase CaiB-like acyl-CoA transferase
MSAPDPGGQARGCGDVSGTGVPLSDSVPEASPRLRAAPLHGVRVLDFGQGAAAPWCTQLLGDFGAQVLKIEPPGGDWGRTLGPPFLNGVSSVFLALNRNKRSLEVNLKQVASRDFVRDLARRADVVVENFRPGAMARLGLGQRDLEPENPGLVYCSISGFGQSGPWSERPAVDGVMQAISGFMSIIGSGDEAPSKAGIVADMFSGTLAAFGALVALYAKRSDGGGQRVDVSLLTSMLALQTTSLTAYLNSGEPPARLGTHAPYAAPNGAFRTREGYIQIAAYMEGKWEAFCQMIGRPDLTTDDRFVDNARRATNQDLLKNEIERALESDPATTWVARCEAVGISCAPVLDYPALIAELRAQSSPDLVSINHPRAEEFSTVGPPLRLSGSSPGALDPPPELVSRDLDLAGLLADDDPWAAVWEACASHAAAAS